MNLLFASSNPHKVAEIRAILSSFNILSFADLPPEKIPPEPDETGSTFAENARIKALAYARAANLPALADDSGLVVDALHGAPGIHSARFARPDLGPRFDSLPRDARDAANNAKLLEQLKNVPFTLRTARFVCAMCLAHPGGRILAESLGEFHGLITDQPAGSNGFGYDPLFFLPDSNCTSAQLPPAEKNRRSHRAAAARIIADLLPQIPLP